MIVCFSEKAWENSENRKYVKLRFIDKWVLTTKTKLTYREVIADSSNQNSDEYFESKV